MRSNCLVINAQAKINLVLDILFKRCDGYHEVEMVMQSIALADRVVLKEQAAGISVSTNIPGLDCGPSNLAYRAAALLADTFNGHSGVYIELDKKIPLAAGLAGGSTDAAAVLSGLNQLWKLGLGLPELERLAAAIGSDVSFCLHSGTMLATGRGEKLTRLPPLPRAWIVLAKPLIEVSTAWAYQNYRPEVVGNHPDINGMIACLKTGDLAGVAGKFGNVLESVTIAAHPEIAVLKETMLEYGAIASMMSGSGPTVFALAAQKSQAENIARALASRTDAWVFVTETV